MTGLASRGLTGASGVSVEDMLAVVTDKHGTLLADSQDRAAIRRALKASAWWTAAQAASASV